MTSINDVIANTLSPSEKPDPSRVKNESMGQQEFLKLMVAQMNFQNPLEPQSNAEFLSQMAQFGTVDGIGKLQGSMDSMQQAFQSNQALQASALVGKSVVVPTNEIEPVTNGSSNGVIDLPESANNIRLSIYSPQGELVRQLDLGTHPSGSVDFEWDGKDSNGTPLAMGRYKMIAEGDTNMGHTSFSPNICAQINSVSIDKSGSGIALNVSGMGAIPFDGVTRIK